MHSQIEQRLAELKADGVAPITAIKVIHTEFGLPLAAAKDAFAASRAWAKDAENNAQFHEEVFKTLDLA